MTYISGLYLECHYYIVNLIPVCMSILHQRKDTGELHVVDPVNLLETCGLHFLNLQKYRKFYFSSSVVSKTTSTHKTLHVNNIIIAVVHG